jgi:6-pyruvoyltetrahydropterin/6-carboxytetrahydropterin synthase
MEVVMYQVIKKYGHEEGWSCTFRQWRADHSHCKFTHGYPLAFQFVFSCEDLDSRNWCLDFGGLKELKRWLQDTFDHKMLVAVDDPEFDFLLQLKEKGLADLVVVPDVGCEKFAEMAYRQADKVLDGLNEKPRVRLVSVMVSEHGGNSAVYLPKSV